MKNAIFLVLAAFLVTVSASAQTTVDSIRAKYKLQPMPEAMTIEKTFPVLGTYRLTNTADTTTAVTVSLDSVNKGMIWVEGLPQGRFKAVLRQSPSTYRVVSQKLEGGKSVPEGTLIFDPATSTLNIALGKAYDDANPAEIFALSTAAAGAEGNEVEVKTKTKTSKTKSKVVFYTATKDVQNTTTSTQQLPEQSQQ